MKYKCVIFDCDGVLVDSETISNQVIVDLANKEGADIDLAYAIKKYAGTSLTFVKDDLEKRLQKKLPSNFDHEYRRISYLKFQTEIQPIEGIRDLLERLEIPFCVASNGPLDKMELNLKVTSLLPLFKGNMFSAYELNKWKPDPSLFLHAAKTMGFQPSECAVVEDSLSGIKAANTGGFDVYGFAHDHNKNAFEEEGAIVFNKMNQLYDLLK